MAPLEGRALLEEECHHGRSLRVYSPALIAFTFSLFVVTAIIPWHLDLATCSHAFLTMVDSPSGAISINELFLLKLQLVTVFYHEGTGTSTHVKEIFFFLRITLQTILLTIGLETGSYIFFLIIDNSKWIAWHDHNLYGLLIIVN